MDVVSLGDVDEEKREQLVEIHRKRQRKRQQFAIADAAKELALTGVQIQTAQQQQLQQQQQQQQQEDWQPTGCCEQVQILGERALLIAWPNVCTWTNFALYVFWFGKFG